MATYNVTLSNLVWTRITNPGKSGTTWKKSGEYVVVCQNNTDIDDTLPLSNTNVTIGKSHRVVLDEDSGKTTPLEADNVDSIFFALVVGDDTAKIVCDSEILAPLLGPELVVNGGFDTDTDWAKSNSTISGGKANIDGSVSSSLVAQSNVMTVGKFYHVVLDHTVSSGNNRMDGFTITPLFSTDDTFEADLEAASIAVTLRSHVAGVGTFDNCSIKEIL